MSIVLSLDAGTTGVRALAVDNSGEITRVAYRELTQHFPRPGWVEHDLDEIWRLTVEVVGEVVAGLDEPVAAIGITNQRETVAAWDARTGRPRHRAIVWQDRRTADRCARYEQDGHLETVRSATGLVLDPYFSGTKFSWLLGEGGVEADQHLRLGTIDTWLIWQLTGGAVHATEPSNASRTMLFDIRTMTWHEDLAELLGVPVQALPDIRPSSGRFGETAATTAAGAGIPVSGVAGDQQAALFGQACFSPGMAKNTYGTGSFVLLNVGTECPPPVDGLLTTVAWTLAEGGPATYAYEGAVFVTGAAVQWLRDGLGIIESAAEVGPLAAQVDDTGGVYLVPAFTGLGSPWWDPHARGTIVGLTRGSGRAELARAVVEAMAYQTRDVVDLMTAASGQTLTELRVDGGASVMDLLLQLQADQIGVTVTRPASTELTAVGAAFLAGLAEGVWSSTDDISAIWSAEQRFVPAPDRAPADAAHARWLEAVERSRNWARD
ncbi:MAG: glycerol kinase GlpK [Acidimicrobiales bacterium]